MTFEQYMQRVDRAVQRVSGGPGVYDFVDAPWMDAFLDGGHDDGKPFDTDAEEAALEVLAEADDLFALMLVLRDSTRRSADEPDAT